MSKPSIVFFGNERLATNVGTKAPVLQALIAAGYEIKAVIASHEDSQSRQKRDLELGPIAHRHGIPVILMGHKQTLSEKLAHHPADLGVVVAFGRIIPQAVIDSFPRGIINVHPSLLPLYRGPTPIEQAILDGATETGVSIMQVTAEMDSGPVYLQDKLSLTGSESKKDLADQLGQIGAKLITRVLDQFETIRPTEQDDARATYCQKITKGAGEIDWTKPAEEIERQIRAYQGWPQSHSKLGDYDVIITQAHVAPSKNPGATPGDAEVMGTEITVECGQGSLVIDRLKPVGKTEMSAKEFLAGRKL